MESPSLEETPLGSSSEDADDTLRPPPAPDEYLEASPSTSGPPTLLTAQPEIRALSEAGDRVTHHAVREHSQPDDQLLRDIGAAILSREKCVFLAVSLKIGENEVLRVATTKVTDKLTYEVLKKWMTLQGERATGAVLHATLHDMGWQTLADQFEGRLLGRDVGRSRDQTLVEEVEGASTELKSAAAGLDSPANDQLLRDVGAVISNHEQCIGLAVKLNIGNDEIFKVAEATFTDKLAYSILKAWKKVHGEKATGSVLCNALFNIERQDLAERFQDRLCGRGLGSALSTTEEAELAVEELERAASLVTNINKMAPSIDLLHQIAAYLPKLKHSIHLAESLGLGEDFVGRMRAGAFTPRLAALRVLFKWRQKRSKQATGRVLFDALIAIQRRDIAAGFAEDLLGMVGDWEDFCYDDKHHDFFKLLRGKHIDVVASYECMRCSQDFLSCLHRSRILTHPEYDRLLDSSRTLLRTDMNKKLMDTINQKPSQLQEVFADCLNRYQPQLVMVEEEVETSSALSDSSQHAANAAFSNTPWELQGQDLLQDFKEELKKFFNQLLIVRPFDFIASEDIQPVSELYITLSSISYEKALKLISGPQQICGSQLLKAASQVDAESEHSQELLDLHSLLHSPEGTRAKSTVLFGSAGSGKSLTALKILSEWNNKELMSPFKEFDAIIYVTGRECARLGATDMCSLWQLRQIGFTEQQERFILDHFSCHSDRVLFLIDGWDEAGDNSLLRKDTVLKRILRGRLFSQSSVIITSRPAPNAYPLLEECKQCYSLVGFNDRRLQELFNRHLSQPLASSLFNTLSQSSHLHVKAAIQKTPLFAAMLVELYKMENTLPATITALYQLMLDSIRRRYVQWVKQTQAGSRSKMMRFDEKPAKSDFDNAKTKLSEFAFDSLMSNKVTFSHEEALSCGEAVVKPRFGLLSEVKEIGLHGSVLYHFSHLTWQEYLAAYSLANDPDFITKLKMCVSSIGVREHTHMFWQFLAGLMNRHQLPDLIFELAKAGDVSGEAPWETEFRLFLIDCVAELIRMCQVCGEQAAGDPYVQLAAEMTAAHRGALVLNGCILDTNHLLSIAVMLKACPCINYVGLSNCRVDYQCPTLTGAVNHLRRLELREISGQAAVTVVQNFTTSLNSANMVDSILCHGIRMTNECLLAVVQLINNSQTVTELSFERCAIGSAGLACWSRTIGHSPSLQILSLVEDNFAGAGGLLGRICGRLPHLQSLAVEQCSLDSTDLAGVLAGLQNSCKLRYLNVAQNQLTDDIAVPLIRCAAHRNKLAERVLLSFGERLCRLTVILGAKIISKDLLFHLADKFPAKCELWVLNGELIVSHSVVEEICHLDALPQILQHVTDGHVEYMYPVIGYHGAIQIAHFLTKDYARQIKSLNLRGTGLCDSGAAVLASSLPHCSLQGLDLSLNRLTLVGFCKLMSALSAGSLLQYLNLGRNPIFASCSSPEGKMLPSILALSLSVCNMRILSMTSTSLSDELESGQNSVLALMAIPGLSALDLSNNDITDKSITIVTDWMIKLEYLSLSGNRISSDGGRALIEKAESLVENAEGQSAVRLQRLWLGRNNIGEGIFTEHSCRIISSESFSLQDLTPKSVPSLFSSAGGQWAFLGQNACSPFWIRMNAIVMSNVFDDVMDSVKHKTDWAWFDRWLGIAACALACHKSDDSVREAQALTNLFAYFGNWHNCNEANKPMALASLCCVTCVIDELVITCGLLELEPRGEEITRQIARLAALDSDFLRLVMQCMSSLAERCHRRQLHLVADKLLQRKEYLYQQVWADMLLSMW